MTLASLSKLDKAGACCQFEGSCWVFFRTNVAGVMLLKVLVSATSA
jgi:hypothetical protein